MTDTSTDPLFLQEQIVRIDKMIAETHRDYAEHDRRRQEIRHAPWQVAFAGMTAGAALMAAGVALGATIVKLFG